VACNCNVHVALTLEATSCPCFCGSCIRLLLLAFGKHNTMHAFRGKFHNTPRELRSAGRNVLTHPIMTSANWRPVYLHSLRNVLDHCGERLDWSRFRMRKGAKLYDSAGRLAASRHHIMFQM
jgi:hypothetical protein